MVIATSDSCNTLVSLNQNDTKYGGLKQFAFCENGGDPRCTVDEPTYERTHIYLPRDDFEDEESFFDADEYWNDSPSNYSSAPAVQHQPQHLYVPASSSFSEGEHVPIDEHLRAIPEVMESADILLANPPQCLDKTTKESVLYVGQGEVAHAVGSQCDIVASDKATTCHIVAFRSTSCGNPHQPLVSLTHVDSDEYETCLRNMIQHHKAHHSNMTPMMEFEKQQDEPQFQEEKKDDDDTLYYNSSPNSPTMIDMDIHIMGGFNDEDGCSRQISESTMRLLVQIAKEEQHSLKMTLKTCAITSMNDTGYQCPLGRGFAINIVTGQVFLCQVSQDLVGPQSTLRGVRLWSTSPEDDRQKQLTTIHTSYSNELVVTPFHFEPFKEIDALLRLPDEIMIRYTSTSPQVEENDFCANVRQTLRYMRNIQSSMVFGVGMDQPLTYRRQSSLEGKLTNEWIRTN
mmetsp:Transcript_24860/g.34739  ORF Transcript_24860/g.34739 Transcript_24860/m.34739 type:complete len:457 (+) Transcript_24860:53-1423(+)